MGGTWLERFCFLWRSLHSLPLRLLRRDFIPLCTGPQSSPPRRLAPRWPILRIGLWELVIPAVRRSYYSASWGHSAFGIGHSAQYRSTPSTHQKWNFFIGPRSRSRRPWARLLVTGWPIQRASDTKAERSYLGSRWQWSRPLFTGQRYRG